MVVGYQVLMHCRRTHAHLCDRVIKAYDRRIGFRMKTRHRILRIVNYSGSIPRLYRWVVGWWGGEVVGGWGGGGVGGGSCQVRCPTMTADTAQAPWPTSLANRILLTKTSVSSSSASNCAAVAGMLVCGKGEQVGVCIRTNGCKHCVNITQNQCISVSSPSLL